ncbi:TIGR04066 family peptide maturation system protein [Halodesulfovibrio sp.]|uniref:TIGR04066 family peptide maturation system protein n=1 Tax=Halodesulfovibrio sp. TaxID=1912772 RepID=UPI0025F90F6C|nr:TIGR04066 family peptide maturation system protein [Halodesulfovibrio sp.]MCT4625460.1 TIGR04066 family peptide maturation system protein [Halodesulfovibrio sp.]
MKEKTLVYPFDKHFAVMLRKKNILATQCDFTELVSPAGWGLSGLDAGMVDFGSTCGIIVHADFNEALRRVDTVFFTESDHMIDKETLILPKIKLSIEKNKNIICALELTESECKLLASTAKENGVVFTYCRDNQQRNQIDLISEEQLLLRTINTPVVMVLGTIEDVGKFTAQVSFAEYLQDIGYKVSVIGSRGWSHLICEHSVPSFMFDKNYHEHEKVVLFNNFVKKIELEEKPDVIIIGVPGGLIQMSQQQTNRFGITAFEMINAVPPDATFISTYCEKYTKEHILKLRTLIENRFSIEVVGFLINNTAVDYTSFDSTSKLSTLTVSPETVDESYYVTLPVPVYGMSSQNKLFDAVIAQLASYNEVEVL